jgi:hypothetical protein
MRLSTKLGGVSRPLSEIVRIATLELPENHPLDFRGHQALRIVGFIRQAFERPETPTRDSGKQAEHRGTGLAVKTRAAALPDKKGCCARPIHEASNTSRQMLHDRVT